MQKAAMISPESHHYVQLSPEQSQYKSRRWRSPWYNFCGECSSEDVIGCGVGCCLPCCAFPWNSAKVLGNSFWREAALYACCFWILCWVLLLPAYIPIWQCTLLGSKAAVDACADKHASTAAVFYHTASIVPTLVWAMVLGGKRRREMRRALNIPADRCCSLCHNDSEYLNDDCCLHYWCASCALAQETRTILHQEATGQLAPHLVTVYDPPLFDAPLNRV